MRGVLLLKETAIRFLFYSPPCTRSSGHRPEERAKRACAGTGRQIWTGRREKTAHPSIVICGANGANGAPAAADTFANIGVDIDADCDGSDAETNCWDAESGGADLSLEREVVADTAARGLL